MSQAYKILSKHLSQQCVVCEPFTTCFISEVTFHTWRHVLSFNYVFIMIFSSIVNIHCGLRCGHVKSTLIPHLIYSSKNTEKHYLGSFHMPVKLIDVYQFECCYAKFNWHSNKCLDNLLYCRRINIYKLWNLIKLNPQCLWLIFPKKYWPHILEHVFLF